jgi:di/tricarboxylate transporter
MSVLSAWNGNGMLLGVSFYLLLQLVIRKQVMLTDYQIYLRGLYASTTSLDKKRSAIFFFFFFFFFFFAFCLWDWESKGWFVLLWLGCGTYLGTGMETCKGNIWERILHAMYS